MVMAKISEPRPEAPKLAEQPPVTEVLRNAGLEPKKLNPIELEYFKIALPRLMAGWQAAGRKVELEAARWLETQVAQKQEFLKSTNASPAELRNVQTDLRHVHEKVLALEKAGLVATKTERFPYGMMQRQVDELKKMGIGDPYKSTWEQRRIAGIRSMYSNPLESREGRRVELAASKRMKALRDADIARNGPMQESPFSDEYRIKNMKNVQEQMMASATYRKAIEDQNSRFPAHQKTAANMIMDAIAKARNPKADIGPASSLYARAVREYSSMLEIYSKDRAFGRDPKERMVAGLVSEERAIRIAMAEKISKTLIAQQKARPREPEDAIVHNYEFTVAGFGSEEKTTTYQFSTTNPIDSRLFRHALDVSSPEEARSNLAALGVVGLSARAIAEMREGIQDPIAQTQLVEIKAKKGTKG